MKKNEDFNMNTKYSKALLISAVVIILAACNDGIDCNCPTPIPFFDFESIQLNGSDFEIEESEVLEFRVLLEGIEFLALENKKSWDFSFSLMPTVMACSCLEDGFDGLKFPIESISLISNADWNEDLPAGEDLSEFLLSNYYTADEFVQVSTVINESYFLFPDIDTRVQIQERPSKDQTHTLTLTFTKSNGEIISQFLDEVTWL